MRNSAKTLEEEWEKRLADMALVFDTLEGSLPNAMGSTKENLAKVYKHTMSDELQGHITVRVLAMSAYAKMLTKRCQKANRLKCAKTVA